MHKLVGYIVLLMAVALQGEASTRVVCLGGAVTETVFALGAGDRVIAVDDSSAYPPEAASLPRVGYFRSISAEGVLTVKPDLVLASAEAGPPDALAQIERAGARVVRIPGAATAEGCVERVRAIGAALGLAETADALAMRIERALGELVSHVSSGEPVRVLFVFARGAGTLNVAGRDTAAREIIRLAGGHNAMDGFSGYRPLTAESLVEAEPDVVLTTTSSLAGIGGERALWAVPGMSAVPAAKRHRLVALDDLLLLGFGPRLPEAVRELRESLYP